MTFISIFFINVMIKMILIKHNVKSIIKKFLSFMV